MSRILILSDDEKARSKARDDLAPLGYHIETDSLDALQRRDERLRADLVLVDLTAKQQARSDALRIARNPAHLEDIPVIGLLPESQLRTLGPEWAVDDFVLIPWNVAELHARVKRALLRARTTDTTNALKVGDLVMNLDNFEVTLRGRPIDLTYKEYELLRFLATHKDRVHTRDTLLSQVWGYDYFGGTRTVDVHVRRLRTKIGDPNGILVQTVRNVGYRLSEKLR